MALATAVLSIKLTRAIAKAVGKRAMKLARLMEVNLGVGKPEGIDPTIFNPCKSRRKSQVTRIPRITVTKAPGIRVRYF